MHRQEPVRQSPFGRLPKNSERGDNHGRFPFVVQSDRMADRWFYRALCNCGITFQFSLIKFSAMGARYTALPRAFWLPEIAIVDSGLMPTAIRYFFNSFLVMVAGLGLGAFLG